MWMHQYKYSNIIIIPPPPSPEEDAQDVGDEQHQTDPGGEALTVVAPLDVLVLWHVRQGSSEDHEAGRQPGQQRPRAPHVLPLKHHLRIHGRSSEMPRRRAQKAAKL